MRALSYPKSYIHFNSNILGLFQHFAIRYEKINEVGLKMGIGKTRNAS